MTLYPDNLTSLHNDTDFFREAVLFTARQTGLNASLVEKDYFCSLLLFYIYQDETPVVFKGGTSLSKVYANFYRLSEDLDFVIPTPPSSKRQERRRRIAPFKECIEKITGRGSIFNLSQALTGHSESTQYIAYITYNSVANISLEPLRIKVEIGLREELIDMPVTKEARTLLLDPFRNEPLVPEIKVNTLTFMETYAEKIRAALTRRAAAIRDFYDLYYAVTNLDLNLNDNTLQEYVTKKIRLPFNDPIDITPARKESLQAQLETQLKPILRPRDYQSFDLDRAFDLISGFGARIQTSGRN
ncbi:MAG: nucleotidyl transferase AbiEii/AbiGii toxin family protein [Deltaproteobacteria bacterium]|nr:nucleotidyl transferase AbiEii/AbiGii toxin family protein [Deltaproteobacteria bacterium]